MDDHVECCPTKRAGLGPRRRLWIAAAAALAAAAAQAKPPVDSCSELSIDALKAAYLACDHQMSSQRVDTTVAQRCTMIGEALQHRAFDGDFDRLIDWWRRERGAVSTGVDNGFLSACRRNAPSDAKRSS